MSATNFVVGDRVKCVCAGDVGSYRDVQGLEGTVVKVEPSDDPKNLGMIEVSFPGVRTVAMFGKRLEKLSNAPTTPRLFKQGDRVRVATLHLSSDLQYRANVGDVCEVHADQTDSFVQVAIGGQPPYFYIGSQFELVTDAAPTIEYVRTPAGVVAPVDEVTAGGAKLVAGVYWDPSRLTATEAPKPLPEVPTDADTMLRMVDVFLSRGDMQASRLQSVLAALRGPDRKEDDKASTTVPVRRAALPKCAKKADASIGHTTNMNFEAKPFDAAMVGGHFGSHIQSAVEALRAMGREVK